MELISVVAAVLILAAVLYFIGIVVYEVARIAYLRWQDTRQSAQPAMRVSINRHVIVD
jgi:archaellum component FlaF (FlaF/FlaG flagellin family)